MSKKTTAHQGVRTLSSVLVSNVLSEEQKWVCGFRGMPISVPN